MANSHVQGLSLRTQVHVMTLGRTRWGTNMSDLAWAIALPAHPGTGASSGF